MIIKKDLPINVDKEILSGTPVFEGTRVPVSALLDNFEVGVSLDEFLENFPTVKREQAVQVLEYFKQKLDDIKKAANTLFDGKNVVSAVLYPEKK